MGMVEQMDEIMNELERRGISYPDPLFVKVKTIQTTLDGWQSQFINGGKENGMV